MQGLQIPGALPVQPVAAVQARVGPIMNNEEQKRLERFGRLHPPAFSELSQRMLRIFWTDASGCFVQRVFWRPVGSYLLLFS